MKERLRSHLWADLLQKSCNGVAQLVVSNGVKATLPACEDMVNLKAFPTAAFQRGQPQIPTIAQADSISERAFMQAKAKVFNR